jgi:hypothetical protein
LIVAPSRTLERLSHEDAQEQAVPHPLFQASAAALLPVLAFGLAAALAPGRTVGSVIIALMGGTLACLGGVVLSARMARQIDALRATQHAARLACIASLPMLLGAIAVAAVERSALGAAFALTLATFVWSQRAVVLGLRRTGAAGPHSLHRTATLLALTAHAPSLFRHALWTL